MVAPGSAATSLLSELKVRAIIENGRQMCKVDANSRLSFRIVYLFVLLHKTEMLSMLNLNALCLRILVLSGMQTHTVAPLPT